MERRGETFLNYLGEGFVNGMAILKVLPVPVGLRGVPINERSFFCSLHDENKISSVVAL